MARLCRFLNFCSLHHDSVILKLMSVNETSCMWDILCLILSGVVDTPGWWVSYLCKTVVKWFLVLNVCLRIISCVNYIKCKWYIYLLWNMHIDTKCWKLNLLYISLSKQLENMTSAKTLCLFKITSMAESL